MLRRDVEFLTSRLARHRIVDADHVVAQLAVQRAVAIVRAGWNTVLLRAHDPAHLVLVDALAARTHQLVGPRLVAVVEEVAFIERHSEMIIRRWRPKRGTTRASSHSCTSGRP